MVSSGTSLAKNHESYSRTNIQISGLYVTMQTEEDRRRQTPKTLLLLFSGIKNIKIYLVKQQQQKEPQKSLRIFYKNIFRSIDPTLLCYECYELFCVFGAFYVSGMWDADVTKSLHKHKQKKNVRFWHSCIYLVLMSRPYVLVHKCSCLCLCVSVSEDHAMRAYTYTCIASEDKVLYTETV